jgi:hypothetical protein
MSTQNLLTVAGRDADAEWADTTILAQVRGYGWLPWVTVGTLLLVALLPSLAGLVLRFWR